MGTYKEIREHVLDVASEETGGDFEDMAKVALNFLYYELLEATDQDNERREFSLTTASGTSQYGMPLYVRRVINIDDGANNKQLNLISGAEFDRLFPGTDDSGTPDRAYPFGVYGVQRQPVSAGVLKINSTSTADTGNHNVTIRGMSSGVDTRETVAVSGTAEVRTTASFDTTLGVQRVVLSTTSNATFVGNLVVADVSNNVLANIPPYWGNSPSYQWWELHPTPDAAITYTVRCISRKSPLVNDEDWPELPDEYHDLLVYGVAGTLLPAIGKQSAGDRYMRRFDKRLDQFLGRQQVRTRQRRAFGNVTTLALEIDLPIRPKIPDVGV